MENDQTFMLISLNEKESKKLAQVISNDTSRKVLDYLGKNKEATETKLSKELNLPLSTIHYNIRNLMKAKLIESKEYEYSEKGKEVNFYTLAKKFIIITPKKSEDVLKQLKNLIPVGLITLGVSAVIYYFPKFVNKIISTRNIFSKIIPIERFNATLEKTIPTEKVGGVMGEISEGIGRDAVNKIEPTQSINYINKTTEIITKTQNITNEALWFLYGALFVIILIIIITLIKRNKKKS